MKRSHYETPTVEEWGALRAVSPTRNNLAEQETAPPPAMTQATQNDGLCHSLIPYAA